MATELQTKWISVIELLYQYDFHESLLFYQDENLNPEAKLLFQHVVENINKIDALIEKNLVNYTIDRLNLVDKAIIRLAVYELLAKNIPAEVVINEAIELTKEYSNLDDEKQHKFTNRLLDNIYKGL
jgi:N utilization substance protein B